MRFLKALGFITLMATAAIAFVGASSALANGTQLCKTHTGLTCKSPASKFSLSLASGTVATLLNNVANVLCLNVSATGEVLALGSPQQIHETVSFTNCGTTSTHNNCTVSVEEQPLANLLKIALDVGVLTFSSGITRVKCTIFGFIKIDCRYLSEGLEFEVEGGNPMKLTAEEKPIEFIEGSGLCPEEEEEEEEEESTLDGTLVSSEPLHISKPGVNTALCVTHNSSTCTEKDQVKSLHMLTTKPPILYNTVANIECEESLANASVSSLGKEESQKLDVTELTWKGCHTQDAADNCTITSKALPTIDLDRTALNLGTATTLGLKVGIDCTILDLIELDCVYGSDVALAAEGALHKEGIGHGRFTASKLVLKKLEGEGHCPESVKWDAVYEPLEHVYIVE